MSTAPRPIRTLSVCIALAGLALATGLAGCAGMGGSANPATTIGNGGALPAVKGLGGTVYGGSQPISGATVQLVAVGQTGYGSSGTVLASTTTNNAGSWSLTGAYTCPTSATLVYVTATGGNPGLANGANGQIGLMAALGSCQALVANPPTVTINEATTVASVYALAQFMGATGAVGSYAASTTGLINAFATVNNLVSTSTGAVPATTPAGNGVVPQAELNTLADILATCVNSPGGAAGSGTPCGSLLTDATPSGGAAPTNTLQAALDIALHPGQNPNVANLYGLTTTNGPFQPTLPAAPNDWTVALSYVNNGMTDGLNVAVDGAGNVWSVSNFSGTSSGLLSELSPTGSVLVADSVHQGGNGVAIDLQGNAWVANGSTNSLTEYASGIGIYPNSQHSGNGISGPSAVAIDGNDNLWIASKGNNTVEEVNLTPGNGNNFNFISGNGGYTAGGLNAPSSIAVDEGGNAWVGNASSVTGLAASGSALAGSPFTAGGGVTPSALATDGLSHIWATNSSADDLIRLTDNAGTVTSAVLTLAGVSAAPTVAVAIDGGGNVWVVDNGNGGLFEVTPAGVPLNGYGYQGGGMTSPVAMAIDQGGDIWVTNANATTTGTLSTALTEFVGVATPAVTPLAAALKGHDVGVPPGAPIVTVPVAIASGVLPDYTVNGAYAAQLYASGGNSGSYLWSLASGGPALPGGLTLSPSGLIGGTTSVSTATTVTVQVADAGNVSNTATKAFTLTPIGAVPARGNEAALSGSYAMLIDTFHNNVQSGIAEGTGIAGSITFNGGGAISGELDYTDKGNASTPNATFTGYYTYGSDNRGTLVIVPNVSGASPLQFAFSGGTLSGATPQSLRLVEFDDTDAQGNGNNGQMGAGVARLQNAAAFVAGTLNQSFVFGMQGETPCVLVNGNGCGNATVAPFGPLSMVGKFTGNGAGAITFGEEDGGGVNTDYTGITMTGTYTNPDASGRGTITFAYTGTNVPLAPIHYVYYLVNNGEMYLLSADGHATASLLSGDALAQTGTFSAGTLSGNYMGWQTTAYNADGVANYPVADGAQLLVVTASAAGSLTVVADVNNAGSLQLEQALGSQTYTIDANGRVVAAGGSVIFYVVSANRFFGTDEPSAQGGGSPGLLTFQQQTGSAFSCSDLNGNFGLGQVASVVDMPTSSGEAVFTAGSGTYTLDQDQAGVLTLAAAQSSTCGTDSLTAGLGRLLITSASGKQQAVYTVVQGQRYLLLDLGDTTTPAITVLEK